VRCWSGNGQQAVKQNAETGEENGIWERRRARYLLSGLTRCGVCGGDYSTITATDLGCSTVRNKGTCGNRMAIKRTELEERVLGSLKGKLMDPTLFRGAFCDEFTREINPLGQKMKRAENQPVEQDRRGGG
jgi:hypothetical protein